MGIRRVTNAAAPVYLGGPAGQPGSNGTNGTNGSNGTNGTNGANGANGTNGNTVLNGSGAPASTTGANGDFYADTTNNRLYGPKAAGAWPVGYVSLAGTPGTNGTNGTNGAQPWQTPPVAWVANTAYTATAPASAVTNGGSSYVCATSHTSGSTFDASKWTLIAQVGATGAGRATTAFSASLSNVANVASGTPIGSPVTFTATATNLLIEAKAYFSSSGATQNGGLYATVTDTTAATAASTGPTGVCGAQAGVLTHCTAGFTLTGLTVGHSYSVQLYGSNLTGGNTLAVSGAYLEGANL